MTLLEAAQALKDNYGKIDPSWGCGEWEKLTSAILESPALALEKFLIENGPETGPTLRSLDEYQKLMGPVTEPLEAGQIMIGWLKEKTQALWAEEAAEAAKEEETSPSPQEPDYDQIMNFFANEKLKRIIELTQDRALLVATLQGYYKHDWGSLTPDTIEAQEAASSDGETYELAERRIYRMLDQSPETFTILMDVLEQEWPDSGLAAHFDWYRVNHDPDQGWNSLTDGMDRGDEFDET